MMLLRCNLAYLMVECMVNTMVVVLWRHLIYLRHSVSFYFGMMPFNAGSNSGSGMCATHSGLVKIPDCNRIFC